VDSAQESTAALFEIPGPPGTAINKHLTLFDFDEKRAVFHRSVAINIFDANDKAGEAACIAMLSRAGLATDIDIARAFGCHRNTVGRLAGKLQTEGMAAVVPAKRGPKGPHKVTREVLQLIADEGAGLGSTAVVRLVKERTGVLLSDTHIRRLRSEDATQLELLAPDESSQSEQAAVRIEEHGSQSCDCDPPVTLPDRVRGRYMGAALYYPALEDLGLIDVSQGLFRLERSERFGVRAVFCTLFFMTLLRATTLESAKHLKRAEFGALTGTGCAPSVKTLRRKLAELVSQNKAPDLSFELARRSVDSGLVASAYLYVDGHVKAYTGKRHLQKVWDTKRRMPVRGVNSYYVSDQAGRPLLVLTEELSANLAKAMPRVMEATKQVLGDRDFTVIFDRGGYDSELFGWLTRQGIDFITYQRGGVNLPPEAFRRQQVRFEDRVVRLMVADDHKTISGSGPWRRIVIRTKDGHQTPIITSLSDDHRSARIACLMFARWRQENFFKYMRQHHGIDALCSYDACEADQSKLVANPQLKAIGREIENLRRETQQLTAYLASLVFEHPSDPERTATEIAASAPTIQRLENLKVEVDRLVSLKRSLPAKVALKDTTGKEEILRLEHKAIVDRVKITAYNAEEWLLERLRRHYSNGHDVRALLRSFAELPGEIRTESDGVVVTLDPPDTPIQKRALEALIEDLNECGATYPGTGIPVRYRVSVHKSEAAA
jgi:transposase